MQERAEPTRTTRLGGPDPAPGRLIAVIAVALVVALLKPWPTGESAPRTSGLSPRPAASPTATPRPTSDPRADLRLHCHEPSGWRVYAHESWHRGFIRTWRQIQPATEATGPLDAALPVVRVPDRVTALGYCAPWQGSDRPPADARLTVWLVLEDDDADDAVAALELVHVAPADETTLGGLFTPASVGLWFGEPDPEHVGGRMEAPWPVNRYAFALQSATWERWWVVRVGGPPGDRDGGGIVPQTNPR